MGWEIPIFHFRVNGEPRVLAYLKPHASEAYTEELRYVYDLVNDELNEYFNDDEFTYNSNELRLFTYNDLRKHLFFGIQIRFTTKNKFSLFMV
ncbi:hypothetical protein AB3569_08790 [Acinetobacter baumannii]